MATAGNDIELIQNTSSAVVSAAQGNDTYIISSAILGGGKAITISDTQGNNSLQLVGGLQITSSKVAADALQLTLNNGSTVTILGASSFTYDVGGNVVAGIDNADVSYTTLVTTRLGTTVPTGSTVNDGGAVTIPTAAAFPQGESVALTGIALAGTDGF